MRFIKHLMEVKRFSKKEQTIIIPQIVENIKRDCKPFLKEINYIKRFIYRGNKKRVPYIRSYTPREDRIPKDMPTELHEKFDDAFYNKFGWKPRGSGVFTTFRKHTAKSYGQAHLFFPIGRYEYIWSPEISDLFSEIEGTQLHYGTENIEVDHWTEQEWEQIYGEDREGSWWYKGEDTGTNDKDDAFEIATEIEKKNIEVEDEEKDDYQYFVDDGQLVWIPDRELEDFVEDKISQIEEENEEELQNLVNTYIDNKLIAAKKKDNEIMFKCKKYYLVNGIYEEDLKERIFT